MSTRSRPGAALRHALWLGGLLVVLGGLFGMHGLDNHGGAGMDSVAHATMTNHAGHQRLGLAIDNAHDAVLVAAAVTDATGDAGTGMGAAGVCMAVLVLSLISLVRILSSRREPLLWLVSRPERAPRVRGRDPDPPSLIHLSIQRC